MRLVKINWVWLYRFDVFLMILGLISGIYVTIDDQHSRRVVLQMNFDKSGNATISLKLDLPYEVLYEVEIAADEIFETFPASFIYSQVHHYDVYLNGEVDGHLDTTGGLLIHSVSWIGRSGEDPNKISFTLPVGKYQIIEVRDINPDIREAVLVSISLTVGINFLVKIASIVRARITVSEVGEPNNIQLTYAHGLSTMIVGAFLLLDAQSEKRKQLLRR